MSTTLNFDLGFLNPDVNHTVINLPTFEQQTAAASIQADVNVAFNWDRVNGHGDWKQLFLFKSEGDDFSDASNNDVLFQTDQSKWFSSNIMDTSNNSSSTPAHNGFVSIGAGTGLTTAALAHDPNVGKDIARDLLQSIAFDIFGNKKGGLDMFSNEETMLTNLRNETPANSCMKNIKTAINTKLTASNAAGQSGTRDNSNFAHYILSTILANTGRRTQAIAAFNLGQNDGGTPNVHDTYHNVDMQVNDTIVFTLKINPLFDSSGSGALGTTSGHGVGDLVVKSRTYRITLTLTDST
jgi:hypothetical protein